MKKTEIRIYQIDEAKDDRRVMFRDYESTIHAAGRIDFSIYDCVYCGETDTDDLETIFWLFNMEIPSGYTGHSVSVSDIIEICDGEKKGLYFCDSVGWVKLSTDPREKAKLK